MPCWKIARHGRGILYHDIFLLSQMRVAAKSYSQAPGESVIHWRFPWWSPRQNLFPAASYGILPLLI